MNNSTLKKMIDAYLNPVETPLVLGCLFLGGLVLIGVSASLKLSLESLGVVLLIYVVTSPLWIYKIISTRGDGGFERFMTDFLRRVHIM